ncbi:TonB-dependent receptor [Cognatiluteimonas profundi]|uniref:TonB-dependent receptor n=1 Tax=Cognatiluteimonas profundi TaxID=2594501 RepID=UPI00131A9292|nr:TonB-dependent receptor [Lysobacter profundi]
MPTRVILCSLLVAAAAPAWAQDAVELETVEVTSAKIPVNLRDSTATVTVVSGADLRARGATDLRTALSLVAGVDIAPGGDSGPAGSVPALWGLREFDAFLLVVDGVPWGGAFTPALATLNLNNVERIEVVKGAAPVSYGATSFVGVIHVLHRAAGQGNATVELGVGSRGSARAALAMPLSSPGDRWEQSLFLDGEHQGLSADRSGWSRSHALYRGATTLGGGDFTVDLDASQVKQQPVSPHPREGAALSDRVPLDANDNPGGARQDEDRGQLSLGYVLQTGLGQWSTKLAYASNRGRTVRGFLRPGFADDGTTVNADGYQQDRHTREVYFDTHVASTLGDALTLVWGADHMHGQGEQRSANFEYAVRPDGANAPDWRGLHIDERTQLEDRRDFSGVYASLDYRITDAWRIDAGLRYNSTRETRSGQETDLTGPTPVVGDRETRHRTDHRWSNALGTSYRLWQDGCDYITAYANYRDSFKPAAIDFGPEAESDILQPETARSRELGMRGQHLDGRLQWDVSMFAMDFRNLVVTQDVGGLPGLTNAGNEHFKGAEAEVHLQLADGFSAIGTWAYHDARFTDYVQLFDGTPTQLDGKHLELSPAQVGSLGLMFAPAEGFLAYATVGRIGSRYLTKRNTATAPAYTTVDAGIGYRRGQWEVRLDGTNLSNRRDPIAESELGESQYYRLPARAVWASVRYDFGS